jgi:UTP--glucose-1-phosphate uridylyltransferase
MKRIRKAIIPAAGLGTRFWPATKAPQGDASCRGTPAIQYIVEEAAKSGIED